jgi:hypothetical protein
MTGRLTGYAKGELGGIINEKTFEKGAFPRTGWARKNQRASPIRARHHRGRCMDRPFGLVDFHIRINRTGPNTSLCYIILITHSDFPGLTGLMLISPLLSHPITFLSAINAPPLFSFPARFFSTLALYIPRGTNNL